LTVVDGRPKESRLEVRVARLLRKHKIKPEATQYRVGPYRIDFALSIVRKLGLECDGFEWHGNRLAWKRDRRRIAALEAEGWRLVHVTWDDVDDRPVETIERVRTLAS
jgi:very-short-patch-repair endonuclease